MSKTSDKGEERDDLEGHEDEADSEEETDEEGHEDDAHDEDEGDEQDEEEAAAPARARARGHRPHDDHGHDHGGAESPADDDDPSWWAPHAVLGLLVMFGLLGFFGVFNKSLGFLAAKPANAQPATETAEAAHPTPATPPPPVNRPPTQMPQQAREMFGAKHLLVMYKGSRRAPASITRTKEEAKARAEEAAKKAKSGKVQFADLVKEYTDEPGGAQRGGDLGTFPKGAMVPEFQAGLEKLKVGETSEPVETAFGYHVILRTK